mmetsp:Transcript_90636/g.125925  ORF Transcript_90636/g.125925 Transcript_90636/m.125925 type:complete len:206 (-) Transcript_90636:369-986(-)
MLVPARHRGGLHVHRRWSHCGPWHGLLSQLAAQDEAGFGREPPENHTLLHFALLYHRRPHCQHPAERNGLLPDRRLRLRLRSRRRALVRLGLLEEHQAGGWIPIPGGRGSLPHHPGDRLAQGWPPALARDLRAELRPRNRGPGDVRRSHHVREAAGSLPAGEAFGPDWPGLLGVPRSGLCGLGPSSAPSHQEHRWEVVHAGSSTG